MQYDNSMFYFEFICTEDSFRILEAEPMIILGKPSIVAKWSPSVDFARERVLSISVWVHFSNIISVFQSMFGKFN